MSFENHGPFKVHGEIHVLNQERVSIYLLLATNLENYDLISQLLRDRAWMVFMTFNKKEKLEGILLKTEKKILDQKGNDFYNKMLNYFIKVDNKVIDFIISHDFGFHKSHDQHDSGEDEGIKKE